MDYELERELILNNCRYSVEALRRSRGEGHSASWAVRQGVEEVDTGNWRRSVGVSRERDLMVLGERRQDVRERKGTE
jgi:hypothetical protein